MSIPEPADRAELMRAFPGVAALEAIERLAREGGPPDGVGAAIARIVAVGGGHGARLILDAAPLPWVDVGVGSLAPDGDGARGTPLDLELVSPQGDRRLGHLTVDAPRDRGQGIAAAIGRAVLAVWSREEAEAAGQRLAALDAATRAVAAELDVDRVLQLIVDRVRELIGARYAALGIDDGQGRIERFITAGITAEERAAIGPPPRGHGLLGYLIREGRSLLVPDMSTHPDSSGFPANHPRMTSLLGVPIIRDGRPVGDLYLTDKEQGEFTEQDREIVELFAVHAGIAIDNARLHEEVARLAVVDERARIGRDLHDGIIQSIYAVGLSLEQAIETIREDPAETETRVDHAIDALNLVIADLRDYILGLRPELIHTDDVVVGLARAAEAARLSTTTDLEISLDDGADAARQLPPDRAAALVSIAREALSNIVRHAAAARGSVVLRARSGAVELCIRDDGRGFESEVPVTPDELGRHQGLTNMRERAVAAGGTYVLESAPGKGTRIIVSLPVPLPAPQPGSTGGPELTRGLSR